MELWKFDRGGDCRHLHKEGVVNGPDVKVVCVKCIIDECMGIHHNGDNCYEEHDPHCANAKLDIWIVWVILGYADS